MSEPLVSPRFIFRFSLPCRYKKRLWTAKGANLNESYRLAGLEELERPGRAPDLRAAWSDEGMAFSLIVEGKKQPPWCRATRPSDSDGLQIWIDTRNVQNVHRAGRFCHRLAFLPCGDEEEAVQPVVAVLTDQPRPRAARSDPRRAIEGHKPTPGRRISARRFYSGQSTDRLRSRGPPGDRLQLCRDRPRVGRAHLDGRRSHALPRRSQPVGDVGVDKLTRWSL